MSDPKRDLLRHTLATVAYRGAKALRGAPPEFATYRASESSRTPVEILAHIGDLFDWALHLADGKPVWNSATPLPWDQETARFHEALHRFDERLAAEAPLGYPPERLFQGPIADALNHVGQIAMLRRMSGAAMRGENYFRADVVVGRVGAEQAAPRAEFD